VWAKGRARTNLVETRGGSNDGLHNNESDMDGCAGMPRGRPTNASMRDVLGAPLTLPSEREGHIWQSRATTHLPLASAHELQHQELFEGSNSLLAGTSPCLALHRAPKVGHLCPTMSKGVAWDKAGSASTCVTMGHCCQRSVRWNEME